MRAERRAPLEDSGGIGGYTKLLATLADPEAEGCAAWRRRAGTHLPNRAGRCRLARA